MRKKRNKKREDTANKKKGQQICSNKGDIIIIGKLNSRKCSRRDIGIFYKL